MAKVLCIGIGKMGFPMAMNLLRAGHEVAVLDVAKARVDEATAAGAAAAADLASGVRAAEFVLCSVPTSDNLVELVTGPDGVAAHLAPGKIFIDTSTVSVASSRTCAEAIEPTGAAYLRCAVNGSTIFAVEGRLTAIASGPKEAYDRALPLLEKLTQTRFYLGDGEQARLMKLAVNAIIYVTQAVFSESAALCEKGGIDWNAALDVFAGSSIASPQLLFKIPPLRNRDFTPAGTTAIAVKDTAMALEAAHELGVFAPVTAVTRQLFEAAVAQGHVDEDFASVLKTIEGMSGL